MAFIVENLPKDGTGCPGKWMFGEMMSHFGSRVVAIRGSWTYGHNLEAVNRLTAGGAMTVTQAAEQTWTGKRASEWGYVRVSVVSVSGTAGGYSNVQVLFRQ